MRIDNKVSIKFNLYITLLFFGFRLVGAGKQNLRPVVLLCLMGGET